MKKSILSIAAGLSLFFILNCSPTRKMDQLSSPPQDSPLLTDLLNQSSLLSGMEETQRKELKIRVIYTRVDRKQNNKPVFTDHFYNTGDSSYFYPASTVKLPVAILALQKLRELNIPGLDRNTTMITGGEGSFQTEVNNDPTAADGRPTIAHYIKKILLVSDNDAFNRLYEFLGQEYINDKLQEMGYTEVQIIHRLSISLSEEENRFTNPIRFIDSSGKVLYEQPAVRSKMLYAARDTKLGRGFMQGDQLIQQPFDFSRKNRMSLLTLHSVIRSVIFPEQVPARQRFNLSGDDYAFLRTYMSMRPGESSSPAYTTPDYWDNYIKMIYYGSEKSTPDTNIRIFNKTGTAYGFLTDGCYFVDYKNKIEFFVSAQIYCNSDGVFNDDKYDYDAIGYPFLKELGQQLYNRERSREKKKLPDLTAVRFPYQQ